jgi:hypothetical protein
MISQGMVFVLEALKLVQPDRPFWKRAMQIALDDLAGYVAPEQVILCEGGQHGDKAKFEDYG